MSGEQAYSTLDGNAAGGLLREAFAFDKTNPNSGYLYLAPPRRGAPSDE